MNADAHPRQGAPDGSPAGARPPTGTIAELLRLAGPIILSRLGIMAMGLTDAIVVGQHSAVELGYHALGWSFTSAVLVGGIGLLMGVQVMTARLIGAGRIDETGAVLRRGVWYAFWLGIGFTTLLMLAGPFALRHAGLDPDLARGAAAALLVFALSLTPMLVADALIFWFEAHGRPGRATAAMWTANAVNLALNLWLVPGANPFGVQGAVASGWATFGARLALVAALFALLLMWRDARGYGIFRPTPREPAAAREQRRIGYASGASFTIEGGAFSLLTLVAGWVGTLVVAGWAVVMNVAAIIFMIPLGLAGATAVLVARGIGARSLPAVLRAYRLGAWATAGALVLLSLIVWFDARLIARAYTADGALIAMVAPALLLSCLFFLVDGLQVVAANSLRARGDIWWPTKMHVVSYAVLMWPLAYLFAVPMGLGLNGIVWGVIVASIVSAVALNWRWRHLGDYLPDKAGDVH